MPEPAGTGGVQGNVAERLRDDRQRFVAFAFAGADFLLEAGKDGRITFAAGAFRSRFGWEPDVLRGRPLSSVVAAEDRPMLAASLAVLAARGRIPPTPIRLADGARTPQIMSGLSRVGAHGHALSCLSFGPVPRPSAFSDPGMCSAAVLEREAESRVRAVQTDAAAASEMDMLEIATADGKAAPMQEVAAALLEHAGHGTIAGELAPGRLGVLYAPEAAAETVPDIADVLSGMEKTLRERGIAAKVTNAQRLSLAGEHSQSMSPAQTVRALRYALSTFARSGARGLAAAGFGEDLSGFLSVASERTAALRKVFAERRFSLAFQPIVTLDGRSVEHYEALLRPAQAANGPAGETPGNLVTIAEMVGLTEELDWAVFEAAYEAAASSGRAIAFNLSGLSVQSPPFRERLLERLSGAARDGCPHLLAEITETAEIENEAAASETVNALRDHGVPVCIDDFGAGAAAFQYLRHFQVDYVKVDGAYVRQAADSERDRGFVAAMVDLSLTVGAQAIAEQIESEAVAEIMGQLGVKYGQGWLFGRPGDLPARKAVQPPRRQKGMVW